MKLLLTTRMGDPYFAGASIQKGRRCVEILRENLERFQRGDTLINLVDKRKGY